MVLDQFTKLEIIKTKRTVVMNLLKVQDTQNNNIQNNSTQHNDIQHKNKKIRHLASISMTFNSYAECRCAEFHGAKNIE